MIKKSIAITEKQNEWLKAHLSKGHYANESEIFRDLIRERQMKEQETPEEITRIRKLLREAEAGGMSERTVDEIMNSVIERKRKNGSLQA